MKFTSALVQGLVAFAGIASTATAAAVSAVPDTAALTRYTLTTKATTTAAATTTSTSAAATASATGFADTSVTHIVAFTFDVSTNQTTVDSVVARMLGLKTNCKNAAGQPYIQMLIGGTDNNPNKRNEAITHAFISQFATIADRNYYLHSDPVHLAFEASLAGVVSRAFALDFLPFVFMGLDTF
ncbi:stress responsive A/B barrel domain-containing protein [Podospora appendiculata]|uniref:Stress responsive A/B barrel domain-containing protein n=1 Tax=Podospora appendiculata TaxID=314037 RepID=A0AAE1CFY8_9PEZI|nr:stress responsive A/B barrel domain-containing protein [Podospora appendiculata]